MRNNSRLKGIVLNKRRISTAQYIALGFMLIILTGAVILMFPFCSRNGETTDFLTTLFTATSATCVTGLVRVDTYEHWNMLGQLIIITLIQIGGMGFVTVGVWFATFMRKRIDLANRGRMQESVNALQINGIVELTKRIVKIVFACEGIGAVCLSFFFIPRLGFFKGLYYSIFHSISAFCNAGFDLMSGYSDTSETYTSLTELSDNLWVNIVIVSLIVIGGIGFMVLGDIFKKKWNIKKYRLQTKMVIVTTFALIAGGAVLFFILEYNNLEVGMSLKEKILTSIFSSVTARTAGFNTVDTGSLTDASKYLTIILMFIGASPGSTAGGIKTTTLMIMVLYMFHSLRGHDETTVFGRRFSLETLNKALLVFIINISCGIVGTLVVSALNDFPLSDVMFECFSAIGTAGMSTGITRDLDVISQVVVILLMFLGRIGSMTFAMAFMESKSTNSISLPIEEVSVG